MAAVSVNSSNVGGALAQLLLCDDIVPGADASYQLCKTIYLYHPLGKKMAEKPITIAMSQQRELSIPPSPGTFVIEAFQREWLSLKVDDHIRDVSKIARIYGIASVIYGAKDIPTTDPIDPKALPDLEIYFNVLDPLNTSGSLVLNQDPNSPDFQKHAAIAVAGQPYHRSRACVLMNEEPIYLSYTNSGYGFVGRSVYQRALFPLKSFVQSMVTDDMVTRKAGLLVAKIKPAGSIVNKLMQGATALKRSLLNEAQTDNVISIHPDEDIETLNMQNADTAMTTARKNILENVASAASMPAKMINDETLAEGFGEGTEDAKKEAAFVDGIRKDMQPLYDFFDPIVMYRAWSPAFYETVQAQFPEEYADVEYDVAFMRWKNAFKAAWPSLLKEPDSELAKADKVKLDAVVALIEALMPQLDPENKARTIQWAADNFNDLKMLFGAPLELDYDALESYEPPAPTIAAPDDEK